MGLFRRTLRDIEKQVHLGKFVQARQALEEHINAEHSLDSGQQLLLREIAGKLNS